MSEPTIVAAPDKVHVAHLNTDGTIEYLLVAAFQIAAGKASPIFWPAPQKGARAIDEQPGKYHLDGLSAESPQRLAQMVRERVQ